MPYGHWYTSARVEWMSSLSWYICLFGYALRQMPPGMEMMGTMESPIRRTTKKSKKKATAASSSDESDEGATAKRRRRAEASMRARAKTVNRTVLAITLFPICLRNFMNSGEDEAISAAVANAIKDLRGIDGQFSQINDTPERFNIINLVGPIDDIAKARKIADEIVKSRGERPRTKTAHICAVRENLGFAVDWERFFSLEAMDNDVEIVSTKFGGPTRYRVTKRQRTD